MTKKDTLGSASSKNLAEAFKCGECLHFASSCHPRKDSACNKQGIRAFAIAPGCFTPDVTAVVQNAEEFAVLSALISGWTTKQRRIFMAMLRGNKTLKTSKSTSPQLKFGTKVYIRMGRDVLTNYYCGYVVGYTTSGELIVGGNAHRQRAGKTFFAYLQTTEGVLSSKEWKIKRAELTAQGKLSDIRSSGTTGAYAKYADYEVPTIDSNPEAFDRKPKKSMRHTELTEVFKIS